MLTVATATKMMKDEKINFMWKSIGNQNLKSSGINDCHFYY